MVNCLDQDEYPGCPAQRTAVAVGVQGGPELGQTSAGIAGGGVYRRLVLGPGQAGVRMIREQGYMREAEISNRLAAQLTATQMELRQQAQELSAAVTASRTGRPLRL